jgi:ferredoxin-NADP reductase
VKAVFDHAEIVARGLTTFWFKPSKPVRYVAGQFTELYLPHGADTRGERRWFTLSSSPTEPLLSITTKFAREGSTYKKELLALKPGAAVTLAEPMGDFVLPKDQSIPLLFVAAGAGITPVRSMIKYLHDSGEHRRVQVVYGVHNLDELAFSDLFGAYTEAFTPVIKQPPAGSAGYAGEAGSLTTERILGFLRDFDGGDQTYIYLSGPEQMVETFFKELKIAGMSEDRLVADYFQGYAPV